MKINLHHILIIVLGIAAALLLCFALAGALTEQDMPGLYLTLEEDKTVDWLNKSKDNTASGTAVLKEGTSKLQLNLTSIHGRGHSSWNVQGKKGYSIKVEDGNGDKVELIPGAGAAKGWNLIGQGRNHTDSCFMNNMVGMRLFEQLGAKAALKYRMVELYINDQYRGVYMLTEKVQINKERIDITEPEIQLNSETLRVVQSSTKDITAEEKELMDYGIQMFTYYADGVTVTPGGGILEAGSYYSAYYETTAGFQTRRGAFLEFKDPEKPDFSHLRKLAMAAQDFEDALFSDSGYNNKGLHYSDYMDLDSLADYLIVSGFVGNMDTFLSSTYFSVDADAAGVKLPMTCGPIWDLNYYTLADCLSLQRDEEDGGTIKWLNQMYTKGDIMAAVAEKIPQFETLIENMANGSETAEDSISAYISRMSEAMARNDELWNMDFQEEANKYKNSFCSHVEAWNKLWQDETRLRGVRVTKEGDTLRAEVWGRADGYQWFRAADGGAEGKAIAGATGPTYTPAETGYYYCNAYGTSIAKECSEVMSSYMSSNAIGKNLFSDVREQDYFAKPVAWAAENNITTGVSQNQFRPDSVTTRGQMVTFLWRSMGCPEPKSTETRFSDVKNGSYYEKAIAWAVETGITKGTGEMLFSPEAPVTRGQMAVFLYRLSGSEPIAAANPFNDVKPGAFYAEAVSWALDKKITSGLTKVSFAPEADCTRGQVVTFLYRFQACRTAA